MELAEGAVRLRGRARLATIAAWTVIVMTFGMIVLQGSEVLGIFDLATISESIAIIFSLVGIGYTLAFIVSVILVSMWIHRAHANLQEASVDGLEFTPGWAVGWYFIPFANLIKPFQGMRELWNASHREYFQYETPAPDNLKYWWGTWIAGNILSNVSMRLGTAESADALWIAALIGTVSSFLIVACAWLLIGLIRDITNAQANGLAVAETFA